MSEALAPPSFGKKKCWEVSLSKSVEGWCFLFGSGSIWAKNKKYFGVKVNGWPWILFQTCMNSHFQMTSFVKVLGWLPPYFTWAPLSRGTESLFYWLRPSFPEIVKSLWKFSFLEPSNQEQWNLAYGSRLTLLQKSNNYFPIHLFRNIENSLFSKTNSLVCHILQRFFINQEHRWYKVFGICVYFFIW